MDNHQKAHKKYMSQMNSQIAKKCLGTIMKCPSKVYKN